MRWLNIIKLYKSQVKEISCGRWEIICCNYEGNVIFVSQSAFAPAAKVLSWENWRTERRKIWINVSDGSKPESKMKMFGLVAERAYTSMTWKKTRSFSGNGHTVLFPQETSAWNWDAENRFNEIFEQLVLQANYVKNVAKDLESWTSLIWYE